MDGHSMTMENRRDKNTNLRSLGRSGHHRRRRSWWHRSQKEERMTWKRDEFEKKPNPLAYLVLFQICQRKEDPESIEVLRLEEQTIRKQDEFEIKPNPLAYLVLFQICQRKEDPESVEVLRPEEWVRANRLRGSRQ